MAFMKKAMHDPLAEIPEEVLVTLHSLPGTVCKRMLRLYKDGIIQPLDFDNGCLYDLQKLAPPLMDKVMDHLEGTRGLLSNASSRGGYLRTQCLKAKRGELDPRGLKKNLVEIFGHRARCETKFWYMSRFIML